MNRLLLAALPVLAGLEVVLVASADDGGVTARLVEEPLADVLAEVVRVDEFAVAGAHVLVPKLSSFESELSFVLSIT